MASPEQAAVRAKKVLIIDDDRDFRDYLASLAALRCRNVVTAEDGEAGLALAQRELPNLILLDMKMPGMNGLELLDLLQQQTQTTDIPVLILTGSHFDPKTRLLFEKAPNVKAFLAKTSPGKQVLEEIDRLLGKPALGPAQR